MSYVPKVSETQRKINRLDARIGKLTAEREELLREYAKEQGFTPCDDCFNGYCSMNCSTAPLYMKVLV